MRTILKPWPIKQLTQVSRHLQKPSIQHILALIIAIGITLLISGYLLYPSTLAYATTLATQTCANTHGTIAANCEKQDPAQCATDAHSRTSLPVFSQKVLIGEVDLRYSPTCNSYWIRTIAYGSAVKDTSNGPVINVEANITFPDQTQNNADTMIRQIDGSLVIWTQLTYGTPPLGASGIYDLRNGEILTMALA